MTEQEFTKLETKAINSAIELEDGWVEMEIGGVTFKMKVTIRSECGTFKMPMTKPERRSLRLMLGLPLFGRTWV